MPEPEHSNVPNHVAIIMDGNGRWAEQRNRARSAGHHAGVKTVRTIISHAKQRGVQALTLFAFSSENWRRPTHEVGMLMDLFLRTLRREVRELDDNGVRIRFIGDHSRFAPALVEQMQEAETRTASNRNQDLVIAVGYGGQWDMVNAARSLAADVSAGKMSADAIDAEAMAARLSTSGLADPDLFIRTGGERRISNFLLWQLAYTELYFCDRLWPDFSPADFDDALAWFSGRQRRFGRAPGQLED